MFGGRMFSGQMFAGELSTADIEATALLGGLNADAIASVTIRPSATSTLGPLTADGDLTVGITLSASATLGGLTATGTASLIVSASASAVLGPLVAQGTREITLYPDAEATLGPLVADADTQVALQLTASAVLGGLVAEAIRYVKPFDPDFVVTDPTFTYTTITVGEDPVVIQFDALNFQAVQVKSTEYTIMDETDVVEIAVIDSSVMVRSLCYTDAVWFRHAQDDVVIYGPDEKILVVAPDNSVQVLD